jgi:hypothetical protein
VLVPEVAMVRFQVVDYQDYRSDVVVAQCCVPFLCLGNGMYDIVNQSYHLVHIPVV